MTRPEFFMESALGNTSIQASQIKEALDVYGCCVLRGLVPVEWIADIFTTAQQQYVEMDARYSRGELSEKSIQHCHRYGILRPFEEKMYSQRGEALDGLMLKIVYSTLLQEVLVAHFGADIQMLVPSSHLRRVYPGGGVPYHQDSSVMRLDKTRLLNCWFPLQTAGVDSPTLEVWPRAQSEIWPRKRIEGDALYGHLAIDPMQIRETLKDVEPWMPVMDPGDVLLLDSYTLHQTHQTTSMNQVRHDFEMRFTALHAIEERTDIAQRAILRQGLPIGSLESVEHREVDS